MNLNEITLPLDEQIDLDIFKKSCNYNGLGVAILHFEKKVIGKDLKEILFVTIKVKEIADLFCMGQFYEKLKHQPSRGDLPQ